MNHLSNNNNRQPSPLTEDIISYWLKNPENIGTAEVIAEWWLLENRINQVVSELRHVLRALVESGVLAEWKGADGRTFYRLNPDRRQELLAQMVTEEPVQGG